MRLTLDQLAKITAQAATAALRDEAGTPSQPLPYAALVAERAERIEAGDE
jgi:hypothetical protein